MGLLEEIARLPQLAIHLEEVSMAADCLSLRRYAFTAPRGRHRRKGTIVVLSALLLSVLLMMVAFAVDLGYLCVVRTETQRAADAAALAAAWEMVSEERLRGYLDTVCDSAREEAILYVERNQTRAANADLSAAGSAKYITDVDFGRVENLRDPMLETDTNLINAVRVTVHRTAQRNAPVPLFFARVAGFRTADITAEAIAIFDDNVTGVNPTDRTGNSSLMPFVLHIDAWKQMLAGFGQDDWRYDSLNDRVVMGRDSVPEADMFPSQVQIDGTITPGNFGTVDLGGSGNSGSELLRQVVEGISPTDVEAFGRPIKLDAETGTMTVNGDTGINSSLANVLGGIIGQPRTILLYSSATLNGNTTQYTIVGFAGVRVVDFNFSGQKKYIRVQPTYVVDPTVVTGGPNRSYFVGTPVRLVR